MKKYRFFSLMIAFSMLVLLITVLPDATITATADDYEYAWFPVNQVQLSQLAFENYSHSYSYHFDCVGAKAVGSDYAFAPFTGKIVYTDATWGFCGLQSTDANGNPKKVYWADGSLDYMTVWFMHGANVSSLAKGQIIAQGTEFFREGSVGTSAAHYDIGVSRGKITTPKDQTGQGVGNYCGCGSDYPYNAFFLNRSKTPTIVNAGKLRGKFVGGPNNKSDWGELWKDLGTQPIASGMAISGQTLPPSPHTLGKNFGVYGVISSNLPISLVWGGVYKSDWTVTAQYAEASPNTTSYNLHGYFNDKLIFDDLPVGSYHYLINATDSSGKKYELINHDFSVVDPNAKTYTVTFNGNGGTPSAKSKTVTYGSTYGDLATATRTGYKFVGWFTSASGGTQVTKSTKVTLTANQTLYAHWTANIYQVAFNANGGSGSMSNQTLTYDQAANLTANSFTKTGYTFAGWNTKADESGTSYADKASVKNLAAGGSITLYAIWNPNTYTIKYDANTGSGSMDNSTMTYDKAANLRKNAYTRTGYSFVSWSDGNGNYYADQASVKNLATSGTVTLWVKWKPNTYEVTLDDGSGKTTSLNVTYDGKYSGLTEPVRDGYNFAGWYTEKDGKGTLIAKDTTVKVTAAQTLYANWSKEKIRITFNANGGTSEMSQKLVSYDTKYGVLPNAEKDGFAFVGWFTEGGTEITSDSTVEFTEDTTVYAKWRLKGDIDADGDVDIDDVIMLQQWLFAVPDAILNDWRAGDLCQDERIDVFDLCLLKRLLLERLGEEK